MDEQQPVVPVFIAADQGQRIAVPRRDPLLDHGLAYVSMCARVFIELGEIPWKMDGALQHACNYIGKTFKQAVDEMDCEYDEIDDLGGELDD